MTFANINTGGHFLQDKLNITHGQSVNLTFVCFISIANFTTSLFIVLNMQYIDDSLKYKN